MPDETTPAEFDPDEILRATPTEGTAPMPDETTPAEFDPDEILRATEAFTAPGPTDVAVGDLFRAGDPIVDGRRHLFAPLAARVRASVPGVPVSPPPFLDPDAGGGAEAGQGEDEGAGKSKRSGKASGAA